MSEDESPCPRSLRLAYDLGAGITRLSALKSVDTTLNKTSYSKGIVTRSKCVCRYIVVACVVIFVRPARIHNDFRFANKVEMIRNSQKKLYTHVIF